MRACDNLYVTVCMLKVVIVINTISNIRNQIHSLYVLEGHDPFLTPPVRISKGAE